MEAVAASGFFDLPLGDMSAVSDAETRTWTRFEANWKGRHRAVELPDHAIPQRLQEALSKFLFNALIRSSQPTQPFWAEDDAVLWVSEAAGHARCDNTGLILYKSGKVVMFGWMHRARNKAFQTISGQVDPSVLQEIFAGFDQGQVDPERSVDPERPGKYQSFHADLALIGGGTRYVVIYKPKPNLLAEIPSISWAKLREVRDKMKAKMLGPDDPPYAELCRRRPQADCSIEDSPRPLMTTVSAVCQRPPQVCRGAPRRNNSARRGT